LGRATVSVIRIAGQPATLVYGYRMTPRNLTELRALPAGAARVAAADHYIDEREDAIKQARAIRNADIRELVAEHGLAKTARLLDIPLSTVKAVRGQA
jgi:hypothetical protein